MTCGEMKRFIEELPDETPLKFYHLADGETVPLRLAESWPVQGVYRMEFENVVTEEMLNEHP